MKTILVILGAVVLIVLIVFLVAALLAPKGYEDESGFHFGDPK